MNELVVIIIIDNLYKLQQYSIFELKFDPLYKFVQGVGEETEKEKTS